jgi:CRP-like cAMP-binding protein
MTPELLKSISAFASVDERHLRRLAECARETTVPAGVDLVLQGGKADAFVVIVDGAADVMKDSRLVGRLTAGDCFGELGTPNPSPHMATVTARTPMRLVSFAGWDLSRLEPDVLREVDSQLDRHLNVHID